MEGLSFKGGILGFSSPISFNGAIDARTHTAHVSALGRGGVSANANGVSVENSPSQRVSESGFSFTKPLGFLWRKGGEEISLVDEGGVVVNGDGEMEDVLTQLEEEEERHESWVLKILHVGSRWEKKEVVDSIEEEEQEEEEEERVYVEDSDEEDQSSNSRSNEVPYRNCGDDEAETSGVCEDEVCGVCEEEGDEQEKEKVHFDRDSFSRLLRKVSLKEAELYAKMSYLGNLAYSIPKIKPVNLMKYHGLRFVTSSVEKKELSVGEEKAGRGVEEAVKETVEETEEQRKSRYQISASAAYHIAASAASYLQSHTRNILSFKSAKDGEKSDSLKGDGNADTMSAENASFVATTNSVTAVVAGEEEMKQAVAKDLNSAVSSPCGWFICDDDQSATRLFVIQGSESMASWQANLLFEPIPFEGLDVLVHRGIYEAAKGIYEQMLPEVRSHLKSRGDSATLRFTGHSLGGSLSLLINLMLLIRGEVPRSCLLPVITFGAPSILCGGDQLLRRLGLPKSHVKAITMHRDIVPRAFSCNYPNHVAEILKAVNGNFRNHPCLKNQKLLYAPMGEILILQPEEKFSPHHELLPTGSGLYLLSLPGSGSADAEKQLRAAQTVFFNSPHPLDMLSDRSAYGSDGTVYRDHDVYAYLRSVLGVLRVERNQIRKVKREHRREAWWPIVAPRGGVCSSIIVGHQVATSNFMSQQQHQPSFSGVFRTGRESVKRFSRLVASQHMHLLIVLLFPARLLLLGASFG